MANKVLVIRKPDKTVRSVPLSNKAALLAYNKKLKVADQWTFEEMDEEEAAKLEPIDHSYVTAGEALQKVGTLQKTVQDKDAEIAELKALLAKQNGGDAGAGAGQGENEKPALIKDLVEKINAAETEEAVLAIAAGDERKGVIEAAGKRIEQLNAGK